MAYERSESTRVNFGKFIHQFQSETKTLIRNLERISIKLFRENVSLMYLYYIYIYIYIYMYISIDVVSTNISFICLAANRYMRKRLKELRAICGMMMMIIYIRSHLKNKRNFFF